MEKKQLIICHIVAFLTVVVWGSTFVFTKLLLLNGLSTALIFTLRFIIAYVLLLAFAVIRAGSGRHPVRWLCSSWRDELLMLALGVTGGSLYFLTENEALRYTTTTNTSLIVCSCPLVAALLISLFYRSERLRRLQVVGSLLAVAGVAVVVLNGRFGLPLSPMGDALALGANLCWAFYSLLMIPVNKRYDAVFITRKVFFYGLLTIIPYYIYKLEELPAPFGQGPGFDVLFSPAVLGNLLFLGCIASMLCFLLWTWVMRRLGAVVATNYVYINPIATVIFAWWILSEKITPFFVVGSLLIILGMYLADRKHT